MPRPAVIKLEDSIRECNLARKEERERAVREFGNEIKNKAVVKYRNMSTGEMKGGNIVVTQENIDNLIVSFLSEGGSGKEGEHNV